MKEIDDGDDDESPNLENNDVNHDIGNVTERVNTMYYILLCLFTLIFSFFLPNTQTILKKCR